MNSPTSNEHTASTPASKITGAATEYLFSGQILKKYDVRYYRCSETGFIQTESPHWFDEAYSDVIAHCDTGLLRRCLHHRNIVSLVLKDNGIIDERFVDFGGGYGIFTRLMRDRGFQFWHHDPMCQNLFAKQFDCPNLKGKRFRIATAFEVFEHIENPKPLMRELLHCTDTIIFSTLLVPSPCPTAVDQWWYFLPETGQHVSFYTHDALRSLADEFGCRLYTNGSSLHAFSRAPLRFAAADERFWPKVRRALDRLR